MWNGWAYYLATYLIGPIWFLMSKSSKQGCQTTLYCLFEEPSRLKNGNYYSDCEDSI